MDIMAKWERSGCCSVDPWTRQDGQRLLLVGGGRYAVREDLSGRLIAITKNDMIVGRDERRVARLLSAKAKEFSQTLALYMLVDRKDVIGKGASIKARRTRKRRCQCYVVDGKIVKPPPFVTYKTGAGLLYRQLEMDE